MPQKHQLVITSTLVVFGLIVLGASCSKTSTSSTTNQSTTTTNDANGTSLANTDQSNTNDTPTNTDGTATNSNASAATTVTVALTSAGVANHTITVAAGTTVSFVNNDSTMHQIASNPHPTHTDLPGFDLAIPVGGSAPFTFMKVGSWGFHDHLNPFSSKFQGTVVVQ